MTNAPTPEAPAPQAAQPAAPQVDISALVAKAAEAATKAASEAAERKATEIAAKRIQDIGRAMVGEPQADPGKQFLETFVADPVRSLHSLKEITKRELKEEMAEKEKVAKTQVDSVGPFIKEYPELNSPKKLAMVEALANQQQALGLSYGEALKKACEETVKEFGLKSVSEAERDGSYAHVALPGGGGYRPGAPKQNEEKSQTDFLSGMRSKMSSFRKKS